MRPAHRRDAQRPLFRAAEFVDPDPAHRLRLVAALAQLARDRFQL